MANKTKKQDAETLAQDSGFALNNMGISLLERRCYTEAIDVFQDALAILQQDDRGLSACEIEHKLYCASLHLSWKVDEEPPMLVPCYLADESESVLDDEPSSSSVTTLDSSFSILNQYGEDLTVSTSEYSSLLPSHKQQVFYLQEALSNPASASNQRLKNETARSAQHSQNIALALLLHNQGQAHHCLASQEMDSNARVDALLERAAKFFHSSRTVLEAIEAQDQSFVLSPAVAAALHRTKLLVEGGLGLNNNDNSSSQVELVDYSVPAVAKRQETPTVSLSSMDDDIIEQLLCNNAQAA